MFSVWHWICRRVLGVKVAAGRCREEVQRLEGENEWKKARRRTMTETGTPTSKVHLLVEPVCFKLLLLAMTDVESRQFEGRDRPIRTDERFGFPSWCGSERDEREGDRNRNARSDRAFPLCPSSSSFKACPHRSIPNRPRTNQPVNVRHTPHRHQCLSCA